MVLNIALVGAVCYGGMELRREWQASKARQAELLRKQVKPAPAIPFPKPPEVPPVMAAQYASVAQKFLLDPSRNSDIILPPPPPPPEAPKMPALPLYHGMMNVGNGPELNMSVSASAMHQWVRAGGTIGEFKVVSFSAQQIELEWNGQRIVKNLSEIEGHGAGPAQQNATSASNNGTTNMKPAVVEAVKGPGEATNIPGERACQEGDTTPFGTVRDGLVKTPIHNGLLGSTGCLWKPVGR